MTFAEKLCLKIATQRWLSKRTRIVLINMLSDTFMKGFEFETGFFGFRYRGNTANILDRKVLFSGCHECDALAFMKDMVMREEAGVFVDVGANVGHHALYMSRYASRVYAFEPYEPVRRKMEEKLLLNRVDNVTVVPVALGVRNESKRYFSPPDENTGMGSFVEEFSSRNREGEMLEVRVADEVFPELGIERADLIKIDVEGFEKQVLLGAQAVLKHLRPIVLFECSLDVADGFHGYDDVKTVFPGDYEFFKLSHSGKRRYGMYCLRELTGEMFAGKRQLTVIAAPAGRSLSLAARGRLEKSLPA